MINKILVVDDDKEIREWLELDLKLSGYMVEAAKDGLEGLNRAINEDFNLIILDVMMPKMNGFEVCQNIRKVKKDIPVIILTAKGTIDDKIEGFDSGANDYLVKPFDIQELLVRVRALLRRNETIVPSNSETLEIGEIKLFPDSLETSIASKIIKLTPTEFEILYCLMQHVNQAVSYSTLLDEVWGYDADEDVRMVRVHVGCLRQKIEPNPKSPSYVKTVTNVGYKLTPFFE
ncbi:MAG: response regulator transcription factor [Candidatus Gastranaerophilales bacterium]|nr:response regulator transcription factor [Candidatus Gastranaerophilales bacterium]